MGKVLITQDKKFYSPWSHKESDRTEQLTLSLSQMHFNCLLNKDIPTKLFAWVCTVVSLSINSWQTLHPPGTKEKLHNNEHAFSLRALSCTCYLATAFKQCRICGRQMVSLSTRPWSERIQIFLYVLFVLILSFFKNFSLLIFGMILEMITLNYLIFQLRKLRLIMANK